MPAERCGSAAAPCADAHAAAASIVSGVAREASAPTHCWTALWYPNDVGKSLASILALELPATSCGDLYAHQHRMHDVRSVVCIRSPRDGGWRRGGIKPSAGYDELRSHLGLPVPIYAPPEDLVAEALRCGKTAPHSIGRGHGPEVLRTVPEALAPGCRRSIWAGGSECDVWRTGHWAGARGAHIS